MEVSEATKVLYRSNSTHKTLHLKVDSINVPMSKIHSESMMLKESILEKDSIEFVGCISSQFQITIQDIDAKLKGKPIEVSISTDDTKQDPIPLFIGIIDSVEMQSNKAFKKITAYDKLYTVGNKEVADWIETRVFPMTIKQFRDDFFKYLGVNQEPITLPNDNIEISLKKNNTVKALNVIKAICQINGAFGIINRFNNFEYRFIPDAEKQKKAIPSISLFPSLGLYPMNVAMGVASREAEASGIESFSFYKSVDYQDYLVRPVDKITVRKSASDVGMTYGFGVNKYIIQGNMFLQSMEKDTMLVVAKNIYSKIKGFSYRPFQSDNNGLPWLEVGLDSVDYMESSYSAPQGRAKPQGQSSNYFLFSRTLNGIQALRDKYSAKGEEEQKEFITDLGSNVDDVRNELDDYKEDIDNEIDDIWEAIESGEGGVKVESVDALPSQIDEKTIYLIRGTVVVN